MALTRRRRARRRRAGDPLTWLLAGSALLSTGGVVGGELARMARRGSALQTVEVAVEGYRRGSMRENALLNLLLAFNLTWATARISTWAIRRRGTFGPFRNAVVGRTHVHHFVPGIALALLAGGVSILSREEGMDALLAVPFGAGAALTLDESALLLRLDDVYWTEEGVLSVQISLASLSLVSAVALAMRVLRRGERTVLEGEEPA